MSGESSKREAVNVAVPFVVERRETALQVAVAAVDRVMELVTELDRPARLALATGRTYLEFYRELGKRNQSTEREALERAEGFNLDELVLPDGHPRSFAAYMEQWVWNRTALEGSRFAIPDVSSLGSSANRKLEERQSRLQEVCDRFEEEIAAIGTLDVALLGVGVDGHVGYNLPGPINEGTHFVVLPDSLAAELEVPKTERPLYAVTVGFAPLRRARHVVLIATGESKREPIRRLLTGPRDPAWPCTLLRDHPGLEVFVDEAAASAV